MPPFVLRAFGELRYVITAVRRRREPWRRRMRLIEIRQDIRQLRPASASAHRAPCRPREEIPMRAGRSPRTPVLGC